MLIGIFCVLFSQVSNFFILAASKERPRLRYKLAISWLRGCGSSSPNRSCTPLATYLRTGCMHLSCTLTKMQETSLKTPPDSQFQERQDRKDRRSNRRNIFFCDPVVGQTRSVIVVVVRQQNRLPRLFSQYCCLQACNNLQPFLAVRMIPCLYYIQLSKKPKTGRPMHSQPPDQTKPIPVGMIFYRRKQTAILIFAISSQLGIYFAGFNHGQERHGTGSVCWTWGPSRIQCHLATGKWPCTAVGTGTNNQ